MNERIKILWETANIRFTNDYQLSGKPREECRSVPDIFAELIVKECASICYNSNLEDSDLHAQNLLYEFNIDDARNQK